MDAKKRVAVPASWLSKEDGELFHVVPHPTEGYLMVMPTAEFDRWEQRIQETSLPPAQKRMAIRKFYSEAHSVTTDKQGRILLNEKHCERAGLTDEVVFVGGRAALSSGAWPSTRRWKPPRTRPTRKWRQPSDSNQFPR